ncbi:MAG: hypothetical protein MRY74_01235 [Neomegalonema sp.]|nr:hypothetical protein [Neomegalonema sp.]
MAGEVIKMKAQIVGSDERALDPQNHDSEMAREIAKELCDAMTKSYGERDDVRPETLAIAAQTVIETLMSGIEREGVNCASMRVALANSLLVNGDAKVEIEVDGESMPSSFGDGGATFH